MKKVLCTMFIMTVIFVAFFAMTVSAAPVPVTVTADGDAWADSTYDSESGVFRNASGDHSFKLTLNSGNKTAELGRGAQEQSATKVVIPSQVKIGDDDYKIILKESYVLAPAGGANENNTAEELILSEGITNNINASQVFRNSKVLKKVTLPSSLTTLGTGNLFYGCLLLESIEIPENITSIPGSTFQECKALKTVTFKGAITTIGGSAFRDCAVLEELDIPSTVNSIGSGAFRGCGKITSITVPDGITSIESLTFSGCAALTTINLPDSISSIGDSAFANCKVLTGLVIPKSVTSIGNKAFEMCLGIVELVIPAGVSEIKEGTFVQTGGAVKDSNLIFEGNITSFGVNIFTYSRFESIIFKGNVAPTAFGTVGKQNTSKTMNIYYPAKGTGYDSDALKTFFTHEGKTVYIPVGGIIDELTETENGYKADFTVNFWPHITTGSSIRIVAFYNGDELVGLETTDTDEAFLEIETDEQVTKAKLFVWNGFENAKPIFTSDEKPLDAGEI